MRSNQHITDRSTARRPRTPRSRIGLAVYLAIGLTVCLAGRAAGQSDSVDGRFVQGLRDRQLYRLAESFCEKRLADAKLPLPERADLVMHLSQTCVDHARALPPERSDTQWAKAFAVTDEFAKQFPQSNWRAVVRVQGALVLLARGELWRQRAEVTGDAAKLLSESQGYLRTAIKLLRGHGEEITEALRGHRESPGEPSRLELLSLERHLKHHLARAYRNQGSTYAEESPDRVNALQQARELAASLAALSTSDPLAWQGRLEEIVSLRLLKQTAEAERRLADLDLQQPPGAILLRAQAERIRLQIQQSRIDQAVKLAQAGRRAEDLTEPELDLAHLEAYLAAWRAAERAKDKAASDAAQTKANEVVQTIEQDHAPYWARRAEALLASVIADAGLTGNLAVLARAAQGFHRGKQWADAVRTYDEAAKLADQQGQSAQAFDLAYAAATIEHEQQHHAEAKRRYRQLALTRAKHAKAPEAHLLAAFNAAQEARASQPARLDEYATLLREHLRIWPKEATAQPAHFALGQCLEYQRRWGDAIAEYRDIGADHPRFGPSVTAAARCYQTLLGELSAAGKPTAKLADEAAAYFERLVLRGEPPSWPSRWSPAARDAALAACRFRLDHLAGDAGTSRRVEQVLQAALDGEPTPPADWKPAAQCLLVVALAGQRQIDKAAGLATHVAAAPPAQLLETLGRLGPLSQTAAADERRALGKLQSQLADALGRRRAELDDAGRKQLDRLSAHAVAASGDAKKGAELFAQLAAANPKDGEIQEAYAIVLLEVGDRASLDAALAKWREIDRNSRSASPRWFRAKYHLSLVLFRLGDRRRAAEIIQVTQALHPDLGGPDLKARFAELLKQCTGDTPGK